MLNWKQQGPTSWTALTRRFGGKFVIVQADGGDFSVVHLSPPCLFDHPSQQRRFRRNLGQAPSLSEAQAIAAAFISDELRWPKCRVEIVAA
jgi:hypothetical protein